LRATVAILPLAGLLAACASPIVAPEPAPAPTHASGPAHAPVPAPPSPAPPPAVTAGPAEVRPPDSVLLADLWARAGRARAEGRHEEALALWEVVWNADPAYDSVAELLEEEYRVSGLDAFARGRTDEAMALWRKALLVDPDDHKTRAYLAHAEAQAARLGKIPGATGP
jgi:tetratricopeptide (TPR) repeat protein